MLLAVVLEHLFWTSSVTGKFHGQHTPPFTASNGGTTDLQTTVTVTPSVNGCTGVPTTFTVTIKPVAVLIPLQI
ncbi:MAG: hypothetical protein R2822_17015 [Spirosomataceae bacterium]